MTNRMSLGRAFKGGDMIDEQDKGNKKSQSDKGQIKRPGVVVVKKEKKRKGVEHHQSMWWQSNKMQIKGAK